MAAALRFDRRALLAAGTGLLVRTWSASAAAPRVSTVLGTGTAGTADREVANPYGLAFGPDRALYFCDLDNQRIRRLDMTTRQVSTVAGNGTRGYTGDGGPATQASLNMPHEIAFDRAGHLYIVERDSHVVRRVDARTGVLTTFAGTGTAGFGGDGGPATAAPLRQPHSVAIDPSGRRLLICDIGNHRIRQVDLASGTITTWAGTGERAPTPDGAPLTGTPLNGPRTLVFDRRGNVYLALREGNAIYRIDRGTLTLHHVAGTGQQGYTGDGGPARQATLAGPKGLAWHRDTLYIADTESHVIRAVDLTRGRIRTVLGTGMRGDGPEPDPRQCALSRPHGLLVDARGHLHVTDSEAHRIRVVTGLA